MPTSRPNRLIHEKSPYLLQHAYNPVDWFPWSEEAFAEARRRDVPIFLSIGYSTCHWCHVMAHESFEDQEVAEVLNRAFVCIKVDREERPDLDAYYMAVCQALAGSGGWPLTILMTAEKAAFYAGTYFPKLSRQGRLGLLDLVPAVEKAWREDRAQLLETSAELQLHLAETSSPEPKGNALTEETLQRAVTQLQGSYDERYGGFGGAPKFPAAHALCYLLRYWQRTRQDAPLKAVLRTLQQMGSGGVYDQVGFGFHRYSTDRAWLLPHFEKMLYDQATLALAYLEGYQVSKDATLAEKAREICTYVLRDLSSPEGGFYSAQDADSEGKEGKFYLWSMAELREHLSESELAWFCAVFGVKESGNFRDEATGERQGSNILHLTKPWTEWAQELGLSETKLAANWAVIRERLLAVRERRVHPHLDDKILTDWNGLMIAALARAGRVLQEEKWTVAAESAMKFLLTQLQRKDGRLWKRYRAGEAALPAHLDDYAFVTWALLELHQTTQQPKYLRQAMQLNQTTLELFFDQEQGGFHLTAADQTEVPIRMKETYDGAIPAGNSVSTLNNLRLARLTGNEDLSLIAEQSLLAMSAELYHRPAAYTGMLQALDFWLGPTFEVVVAGPSERADTKAFLRALADQYQPRSVTVFLPTDQDQGEIKALIPYLADYHSRDDRATAYVCSGLSCQSPTNDLAEMLEQLSIS